MVVLAAALAVAIFEAIQIEQKTVKQQPVYQAKELYANAVQQIDKGQYQSAESYLEQALSKEDSATYRNQLAVVKYRLKKYQESIDEYQKLIDEKSGVAFAYNGMGNAYRDWGGHNSEAESSYRKSIGADKTYAAAYSNLALLLKTEDRLPEALEILDDGIAATGQQALSDLKTTIQQK